VRRAASAAVEGPLRLVVAVLCCSAWLIAHALAQVTVVPWNPQGTVSLSVTATSGSVQLATASPTAFVCNSGPDAAFVNFGSAAVVATTSQTPVFAGQCQGLAVPTPATPGVPEYIAAITGSGNTASLSITTGTGVPNAGH
jgi:hypothetical protein